MPYKVRAEADWELYKNKMKDIAIDGAKQIEGTISEIKKGKYIIDGIMPEKIKSYIPIIITLENMPLNPLIFDLVDSELRKNNLLLGQDVRPIQIVDIEDLETLESLAYSGTELCELLKEKLKEPLTRHLGVKNYLYLKNDKAFNGVESPYYGKKFDEISQIAVDELRAKYKGRTDIHETS